MKWRRTGRSKSIQDHRGRSFGGGGGGLPIPMGGAVGIPGVIILLLVVFGGNLFGGGGGGGTGGSGGGGIGDVLDQLNGGSKGAAGGLPAGADPDGELVDFMSFVLDDVQGFWQKTFSESGRDYDRATLVLFTGQHPSACGGASSAMGPHYCPPDQKVYLDLGFFRELRSRYGAPGDFAQAYVLSHEIAHHVQNLLGINEQVRRSQQEDPSQANELSIRLELQADCLAGVWAHATFERDILESGDLEEGLGAAEAVGDDRIQEQATGTINKESWTHGSSEQRARWFRRGFDTGDPDQCDTFSAAQI